MIPLRVKVGPHWYVLKYDPDLEAKGGVVGVNGPDTQEIFISDKLGDGIEKETVLHELMHACWHQTLLDRKYSDDDEEDIVWTMAPLILGLLTDNPFLTTWLGSGSSARSVGESSKQRPRY